MQISERYFYPKNYILYHNEFYIISITMSAIYTCWHVLMISVLIFLVYNISGT